MTTTVYEFVTSKILESLDRRAVPRHKPWASVGDPRNATASRPCHGINTVLLGLAPHADQRWLTYLPKGQLPVS